jgi:polyribonucleotide nucleotidyltransferase
VKYDIKIDLKNREEEYSFGEVAKQANGAAWIKSGDCYFGNGSYR